MVYCEYCDSNVEDGVRVCPYCAAPLPQRKENNNRKLRTGENAYNYTNTYPQTYANPNVQPVNHNMYYQNQTMNVRAKKRGSDVLAIVSMVIGIISLSTFCLLGGILGIVGLILGVIALSDKLCKDKAMAVAGVVLSAIAFLATCFFFLIGLMA